MAKAARKSGPLNPMIVPGVHRFSRSVGYHKKGIWELKKKNKLAPKKGLKRKDLKKKAPVTKKHIRRFYPAEPVIVHRNNNRKGRAVGMKLRRSLVPGTVVIILSGRHKGCRAVFLKQMNKTGQLLVTGPFKYNGVPLRRVNHAFVIATSTRLDLSKAKLNLDSFDDKYFAKTVKKSAKSEAFGAKKEKFSVSQQKKTDQKTVDAAIISAAPKGSLLSKYLKSKWGLSNGQFPHKLSF